MQFKLLTSLLALSAPLVALAAPTTASAAPATTSASAQPAINHAWQIVSSLDGTLGLHEFGINFTVAFFPPNPTDEQKVQFNSSVSVNIDAMSEAIRAAVASVKEIARIDAKATEAEIQAVKQVNDALRAVIYRSTATLKHCAQVYHDADIVIIGGGPFVPFFAVFESFVFSVEDIFLSFIPGVEAVYDSFISVLKTAIAFF